MVLPVFLFFIIFFKEKSSFFEIFIILLHWKSKNKSLWTHYTYFNLHA